LPGHLHDGLSIRLLAHELSSAIPGMLSSYTQFLSPTKSRRP